MDTNTVESNTTEPTPAALTLPFPLADGESYAGISRDAETGAWHHLVLLAARSEDHTWQGAIDWAKSVGGDLPSRMESALLYANLRDKMDQDYWHWTATPYAGDERDAWIQTFSNGSQYHNPKASYLRAVAVRRVPV